MLAGVSTPASGCGLRAALARNDFAGVYERHHAAQIAADHFDFVINIGSAHFVEAGAVVGILINPVFGKGAVLDVGEQLLHCSPRLLVDDL